MSHSHHHHHHHHHHSRETAESRLWLAIALNLSLTIVQVIGGIASGSLALLADALHNFGDSGSLLIALIARRWSRKAADRQRTYGYGRAEVVAAVINLTALIVIALFLVAAAVERSLSVEPIHGWLVIAVASAALLVDLATVVLLWTSGDRSVNIRAAILHNLSDALSSIGVIIVGVVVLLWQFYFADVLIALVIAAYVLWQCLAMLRHSIAILMNTAPAGVDIDELVAAVKEVSGVRDVHHLHLWQLDEYRTSLEAHVVIDHGSASAMEPIKQSIKKILHDRFGVEHTTLEIELDGHTACDGSKPGSLITGH